MPAHYEVHKFLRITSFLCYLALFFAVSANAQTLIVGHRGGSYFQYPESSMTLFSATARSFSNDTVVIEIDLRKSKDGTIYLMHDGTIDRTTTGKGDLADLSDEYLNSLQLKTKDGEITNEHIPTFEETLQFISHKNINLMLDIKAPIYKEVLEQVRKHKLDHRMLVLTFKDDFTRQVSAITQNVLLSALVETEAAWNSYEQISFPTGKRIAYITKKTPAELITRLRQNKVLIMADVSEGIFNDGKPLPADAYRAKVKDQQLDIIISDFPIEVRAALGSEN